MSQDNVPRTVLVTGAARRLGRDIVLHLARQGWRVGVHYHHSEGEAVTLVEAIEAFGGKALAFKADLAQVDALEPLIAACAERLGIPTCLVNNAACFEWDDIATLDPSGWQAHLDVDLRAPVFLTQAFARILPQQERGSVIN